MEVMLGGCRAPVTVLIAVLKLLRHVAEHFLIEVGPLAGHSLLQLFLRSRAREIKDAYFHEGLLVGGSCRALSPGPESCRERASSIS